MKKALIRTSVLAVFLLAACGYRPIYGAHGGENGSPVAIDLNNIAIDNIPDRDGQMLRNNLIDRMYGPNRPDRPVYMLHVKLRSEEQDSGILANATVTRSILDMYGDYSLTDGRGTELLSGTAHSVASFDKLSQMYGTVEARRSAHEKTLHEISEQIVNRLSLYFSEKK
ncbi:MAG: LPS assembly lipoprotein LptE [Alphaproteobacteria bacterium]|nr:LPS assembly lipoprotein LptE [Alphaproteobacteria bacterium]